MKFTIPFLIFLLFAKSAYSSDLKTDLKSNLQQMFLSLTERIPISEFKGLPQGIELIEGHGYRGIKLSVGYLELFVDTWMEDIGLLDRFNKQQLENKNLVASVNGTFYSSRGILGQIISGGIIPDKPKQFPGALPRCFFATLRGIKGFQHWFIGESALGANVLQSGIFDKVWFNGEISTGASVDNMIGGGGWILRNKRDVHRESLDRQRFRFHQEDLKSRRTVVAQSSDRTLYFLVFEAGNSLHQIARTFVKNIEFEKINDVFFLDGGASSCIVVKGKYFVPPLYLIDKARFSAIQIMVADLTW